LNLGSEGRDGEPGQRRAHPLPSNAARFIWGIIRRVAYEWIGTVGVP
jgi:hypothetical protein